MTEEQLRRFKEAAVRMGFPDEIVNQYIAAKTAFGQRSQEAGGSAQLKSNQPNVQPTNPTQPTALVSSTGNGQYMDLIKKYFPQQAWEQAYNVMMGESGGANIPSKFNEQGTEESYGPFQINLQAHPQMRSMVHNPEENVKYAAQLYKEQGWQPWFNTAKKLGYL